MTDTASRDDSIRIRSIDESPVARTLEVEVDASRVRRAYDRAYRDLARRVSVRGFRPGKAPRSVLEKLYGASLAEQIEHALVAETLSDALEQSGVEPVSQPEIDADRPEPDAGFRYRARVEVKPRPSLPELRGLPARRPEVSVAEEEVERELESLRLRHAPLLEEPEGTAVARGHVVTIDFVGRVDGRPFDGGSGKDFELEVGSGRFPADFEDQLVGAQAGDDRQVRVRFPEDAGNPEIAGRDAEFAVHVAEIKRRELPRLDDEFAKDVGEFQSLEELRTRVREDLTAMRERAARAALERSVMDALIERSPFETPPGLVERQLERQLETARERLRGSVPEEALEAQLEQWREQWRERAEREVRETLLLEAVAQAENLEVDEAEVQARIEAMAREQGMDPARLRKAGGEGLSAALRRQLADEKALDFLCREAKVEATTDS